MKRHLASQIPIAVLVLLLLLALSSWSAPAEPARANGPPVATLSVLAGPVHYLAAGGGQSQWAWNGMDVVIGDRIITGKQATALITFLDGTTVTVQPESEIAIQKAETGSSKNISVKILLGTVWAHVIHGLVPGSTFSLTANTATATVHDASVGSHDSLIGARANPDGSFDCWTRAGIVDVKDEGGQRYVRLMPGEKTRVEPGKLNARFGFRLDPDPVPQPFSANQSMLKIITSASIFPLVLTEDKVRATGFKAPSGDAVNHVFGSYTDVTERGEFIVEVPAGVPGPFVLLLEGARDGAYQVTIAGFYNGEQVYVKHLSGMTKKGQRGSLQITQDLDPELKAYPTMARIIGGHVAPSKQLDEDTGQTRLSLGSSD